MSKAYQAAAGRLKNTPPTRPIPGREADMQQNNTGGFTFTVGPWQKLMRFLILGSEGGSYYVDEGKLTELNSDTLRSLIKEDGVAVVELATEVSQSGRALKNDPALYALALAITLGDNQTKQAVVEKLPLVARIPTHLFHFIAFATAARGWGRSLKRAVKHWYQHNRERLPDLVTKYPSRDGWSHLDAMRLSRPLRLGSSQDRELYDWVNGKRDPDFHSYRSEVLGVVAEVQALAVDKFNLPRLTNLITAHRLPREVLPTEWLKEPKVWEALLPHMPMTALIRNLGNLSKHGVLSDRNNLLHVTNRLTDPKVLGIARVHPLAMLIAAKTYGQGQGMRGGNEWRVVPQVKDALDAGFTLAFQGLEPTGKRFLIGVDVSASMGWSSTGGVLSAAEAAAGIAVTIARTESNYDIMGFAHEFRKLDITARSTVTEAMREAQDRNFGATDPSLPMRWALENGIKDVDVFITITDNEVNRGNQHASQALREYRHKANPAARMMVLACTPTDFSIADPRDPLQLDVAGFDGSIGQVIREFAML